MSFTVCDTKTNDRSSVFALIDANNFFVSCERVFNPSLNGKPVIVLSNNDGCAIARSNEAKKLGIAMSAPLHSFSHLIKPHDIHIFSTNFELYGDLSNRMMQILKTFSPDYEIYSIDEAFLNLAFLQTKDYATLAQTIKQTVFQYIGIPLTIGIAPTKTLAKLANRIAKTAGSPYTILTHRDDIQQALSQTNVADVWGIGKNTAIKLKKLGIYTAHDLALKDPRWARLTLNITGERLVRELQGVSCIPLSEGLADRQSMQVTRSFGVKLTSFDDIAEAVSAHATRLGEQLRRIKMVTPAITVFCATSLFGTQEIYKGDGVIGFDIPTNDTNTLIKAALAGLRSAFKEGYIYQKAGITAHDLVPEGSAHQKCLFQTNGASIYSSNPEKDKLCASIDQINQRFGKDKTFWASSGIQPKHLTKQNKRSLRCTTQWTELIWVK